MTIDRKELEQRIVAAEPKEQGAPFSPNAGMAVDQLLTALEQGHVRAAERDAEGTWHAVPWVKRGILLAFRLGRVADMSPAGGGSHPTFTFFDKHTVPPRTLRLEAGVRVVPGGDYGFVWCPHGEYAKDIELFVTDKGFTPMEAIIAATKHGSELLRMGSETGTIAEGKYADILVVDGDPLDDIAVLQDRSKLAMVMKDGKVMVNTLGLEQELIHIPDFTMDIEHIQRAAAVPPTMPTAAEVQH